MYETLAGFDEDLGELRLTAPAQTEVLQVARGDLFDLLEQRQALLQQIFEALFDHVSALTPLSPQPAGAADA